MYLLFYSSFASFSIISSMVCVCFFLTGGKLISRLVLCHIKIYNPKLNHRVIEMDITNIKLVSNGILDFGLSFRATRFPWNARKTAQKQINFFFLLNRMHSLRNVFGLQFVRLYFVHSPEKSTEHFFVISNPKLWKFFRMNWFSFGNEFCNFF